MSASEAYEHELPNDLVVQILFRLTPKSLLRFKAVCKSWHTTITSPRFIHTHYDFINISYNDRHRRHLIHLNNGELTNQPSVSTAFLSLSGDQCPPPPPPLPPSSFKMRRRNFYTSLWGPVNGVYCIRIRPKSLGLGILILWNPSIQQSHVLPPIPCLSDDFVDDGFFCGFGFDSSTHDYKVIGITNYGDWVDYPGDADYHFTSFHIYSLATNTWKQLRPHAPGVDPIVEIDDYECCQPFLPGFSSYDGFYFNGACHWIYESYVNINETGLGYIYKMTMVSFDFGSQVFRAYMAPSITHALERFEFVSRVMSVDGCLALVRSIKLESEPCSFDVYVMTEYGVQESWIKAYRVFLNSSYGDFLGIIDNEFFVKEADDGPIVSYCLRALEPEEECHVYCHFNYCSSLRILPYRESLVPVKPWHVKKKKKRNKRKKKKMSKTWWGDEGIEPDTIILVSGSWKDQHSVAGFAWIIKDKNTGKTLWTDYCICKSRTAGLVDAFATLDALKFCIAKGRRSVVIWTDCFTLWESLANNRIGECQISKSGVISEILYYGKDLYCGRIKKVRHTEVLEVHRLAIMTRKEPSMQHRYLGDIMIE